jgi:hypothetical protein
MKNIVYTFMLCSIIAISFSQGFAKGSVVGVIMEDSYSSNCTITHNARQVSCKQYKGLSVGDVIEDTPSIDRLKFRLGPHVIMEKLSSTQVKVVYASVPDNDKNILARTKDFLKKFLEPVKLNDFYGSARGNDISSEEKRKCHLILQKEPYLKEPYSMVLYNSPHPLTFIWDSDFSALVFKDTRGKEIFRENIRNKESIQILPEKIGLKEGQKYTWYYEYEGRPEKLYPLKVLDRKTEKEILDNLTGIDRQQLPSLEKIFQKAAYLQLLSDVREDVDLYWLSYALLPEDVTGLKEEEKFMVCKLKFRYLLYRENP